MTSKEKIDQLLGISENQSVDDFLNDLTMEGDVQSLSTAFGNISEQVNENIKAVDAALGQSNAFLQLSSITESMKEVEDLVGLSKNMFKHVYEQIVTTSLLDAEAINAAAKLLESVHINIAEFINMYKQRQQVLDKMMLMEKAYEIDIKKMDHKHELDMKKMAMKMDSGAVDVEEGTVAASFEDVIKALNDQDTKN